MSNQTGDGRVVKMEVDYSSTVDEKIPKCEKLVKQGNLVEALEMLLSLEKQARTGADTHSTSRILMAIIKMCFDANNWEILNEHIVLLTKKRGQIKQYLFKSESGFVHRKEVAKSVESVTKMIQEACSYVDKTPNQEVKLKLIDTLRTVTAGKIYVEIERARLTRILAKIKEDEGNINEAASILQELQVETFGSMDKKEKVEFILEQMRLCLAKKDYIRTQIISKKISTKFFEEASTTELKLKYYQLMIELDQHEGSYLAICKHYQAIYNTTAIQEDKDKMADALKCVVLYLILAPYDNEQADLLHRIGQEKNLNEIPKYKDLHNLFTTSELIYWKPLCTDYETELKQGSKGCPATHVFSSKNSGSSKRWQDLKNRVVEHNIRVMAKYYTRVRMCRMAQLLDLTEDETEDFLSNLVVNKTVQAKMDRLDGIINFRQHKDPNSILNDWSHNISTLMQLVNKTNHLITKEEMVHKLH